MSTIEVNTSLILPELFSLGDALKAAIFTSAAAILSRMSEDVDANAELAEGHLRELGRRLDGVRNTVSQRKGVSLLERLKGHVKEVDFKELTKDLDAIDREIDAFKDSLFSVLENRYREGIASCGDRALFLGLSVGAAIERMTGKALPLPPLYWQELFLQSLKDLSEKDWGPSQQG